MGYKERVNEYKCGRPSYPKDAVDFIVANSVKNALVADIGAGTGKFTELLAERFPKVYAIDPDLGMQSILNEISNEIDNISPLIGSAENTGLDDNSVDSICVAHAFHWFDENKFRKEALRILRPNGRVFILHNTPPEIVININLNKKETPESINAMLEKRKKDRNNFFGKDLNYLVFNNSIVYDRNRFIKYFLSLSTGPDIKDEKIVKQFSKKVGKEFDKLSTDGLITLQFITELYTSKGYFK